MDYVIKKLNKMKNGYLDISWSSLTELPNSLLWKEVKELHCYRNHLTSLPDLPNVEYLDCHNNQLITLPDLPNVKDLNCYNNQLTTLPDLPNVKDLNCSNNQLTCLPDLPKVKTLNCHHNQLTKLPYLPNIENLYCGNNQLTRLPDLPNVKDLYCYDNLLIYKPKNRKIFNAIFRIISTQKMFKHWWVVVQQYRQERTYQIINKVPEFDILPEEIKLYIIRFV